MHSKSASASGRAATGKLFFFLFFFPNFLLFLPAAQRLARAAANVVIVEATVQAAPRAAVARGGCCTRLATSAFVGLYALGAGPRGGAAADQRGVAVQAGAAVAVRARNGAPPPEPRLTRARAAAPAAAGCGTARPRASTWCLRCTWAIWSTTGACSRCLCVSSRAQKRTSTPDARLETRS